MIEKKEHGKKVDKRDCGKEAADWRVEAAGKTTEIQWGRKEGKEDGKG